MTKAFTFIQNFDVQGGPDFGRKNLPKLREALREAGLDGFLVPHEDEYQNEYLPDCNERLMWVSGFTGSAGSAVIMLEKAAIFVDGRYVLQVKDQVDGYLFSYERLEDRGVTTWLKSNVSSGQRFGFDPRLHSPDALKALKSAVKSQGAKLVPVDDNPIDRAWTERPAMPVAPLTIQDEEFAGENHSHKRSKIAKIIGDKQADAALITAPASIAWLLNIRGGDVSCSPLPLSTAIIDHAGHVEFYVNPVKLNGEIRAHLGNEVMIGTESDLLSGLNKLAGKTVIVDPSVTSAWYFDALQAGGATIMRGSDPVALPKACKNDTEIAGSARAHKRDAVPIINFLHWLDTEAQSGTEDEITAARKLETFRHQTGALIDLSFETISGAGSNGAHCHYRVSTDTNLPLKPGTLYLVDSGGQYKDGTTDITRTVPIGKPTEEMRERFTLVLKGHIALATVRFPEGTTGSNLDALARQPLWEAGLDYDHGTGHGVGVFLGVHEGPQRISKLPNKVALKPGMIVSNEPGYYKTGEYGIRIENLQYVTQPKAITGGERKMLAFENLTWAPIHRDLIHTPMLSDRERDYVNRYHARVLTEIGSKLDQPIRAWLEDACAPI